MIGHYCSGASIPASKVYQKAGILEISPASTNPKYTDEGGWNVVRLVPRDDTQAAAAASLVLEKFPGKPVAIVSDQAPAFAALAAKFAAALQQKGVTPALQLTFKAGTKDFSALAQQVVAAGAGVVYLPATYVEGGLIAQALRDAGSQAQIVSGDSLVTEDYGNQAKDAAEGTLSTFTYDARKFPTAQGVVQRLRDQNQTAEGFTLYAYAAVQALAAAAEATGGLDSTRLAEWLRGPLRDWAEDLLEPARLGGGLLNVPAVHKLWAEHQSGAHNWACAMWTVLMFDGWRRRWADTVVLP